MCERGRCEVAPTQDVPEDPPGRNPGDGASAAHGRSALGPALPQAIDEPRCRQPAGRLVLGTSGSSRPSISADCSINDRAAISPVVVWLLFPDRRGHEAVAGSHARATIKARLGPYVPKHLLVAKLETRRCSLILGF